ncbi:hypothetical protein CTAYLR_006310 [Chrysophaeum taylorii]|uniref:Uncharacterized protein n=1 Tax=Chrysophaeum taylorii TaxID=2483200 RepID=A0AAD7UAT1_9STRA|nr:hypothetical protein CTAYLR_006310 [Chrysophaeum taylorii]
MSESGERPTKMAKTSREDAKRSAAISELEKVREEIVAKEQERKELIAKFEAAKDSDEKQFFAEARKEVAADLAKLQDTLKGLRLAQPHQSEGWTRREDLDRFAAEIIELHGMCCALEENFDAKIGGEVQHAGYGVLVQKPSIAIDYDSVQSKNNAVITRKEQRSVARHAIDATESSKDVIVVGDPGIGKTRGSMFFAMQELLAQNKTVMRVGFKESKIILFKPGAPGNYEVWVRSGASTWDVTDAASDPEAFVLIDPPEKRPYPDMAECRTIKFASNNANEHYPNADKDKIVLVTAPPTKDELCAMVPTLWTAKTAPGETFDTLKSKEDEILRRALLVGCAPRYVFNKAKFLARARIIGRHAKDAVKGSGTLDTLVNNLAFDASSDVQASSSVSGKFFTIAPAHDLPVPTWQDRVQAVASVHELARLALHTLVVKKLKCAQQVYHSSEFGHMFERDVCTFVLSVLPANWKPGSALDALELRRTVIKSDESPKSGAWSRSMDALKKLKEESNVLMYMPKAIDQCKKLKVK